MIEYNINFDPVAGRKYYSSIIFTTGDVKGYKLKFTFGEMDLSDKTIIVKAKRADGAVVEVFGSVANAGEVVIPGNAYAIPGELELEIGVCVTGESEEENECVTACVLIATVRGGFGDSDMTGSDEHNALLELIADFGESQNVLRELVDEAKTSAATANENAGNTAENAKVATAKATEAATWADNAAKSAGISESAATEAKAAEAKATEAATQAANAAESAKGAVEGKANADLSNVADEDFTEKLKPLLPNNNITYKIGFADEIDTYYGSATSDYPMTSEPKLYKIIAKKRSDYENGFVSRFSAYYILAFYSTDGTNMGQVVSQYKIMSNGIWYRKLRFNMSGQPLGWSEWKEYGSGGDVDLSGLAKTDMSNVSVETIAKKVNEAFPNGVGGGDVDLSGVEKTENKINDFSISKNPTTDYPTVQSVENYVIENIKYITPIITLDDYLANRYKTISTTGAIIDTASDISVSDAFYCNEGDKISGILSVSTGYAVFATYDKSGNVITKNIVKGEGYSTYKEIDHTFTADEYYFRISGATARKKYYSLTYIPIDNARADIKELQEHIHAPTPVTYNFSDHIVKGIAHGGWKTSISTPEGGPINTIAAFKLAKQNGFSFVECDTAITSDGVVVLLHNTTVDETSNGTGNISEMTFEQVRELDFGSYKDPKFAGEKIPSFEEFILYCRDAKLFPYIEIKSSIDYPDEILYEMFNTVNRYGMAKSCTWISFEIEQLKKVVSIDPNARVGYILQESWTKDLGKKTDTFLPKALQLRTGSNEVFLDVSYSGLMADVTVEETVDGEVVETVIRTADRIAACKAVNMPIEVWTTSKFNTLDPYISGATSNGDDYEAYLLEQATT